MIEIKQLKGQKKYQEVTKLMNKHIQKMSENVKNSTYGVEFGNYLASLKEELEKAE